jgi:hypothetical protein
MRTASTPTVGRAWTKSISDILIHNLANESPNDLKEKDLRQSNPTVAPHLPTDTCQIDPELGHVVAARPDLPEVIKAGILAIVKAAAQDQSSP